MALTTPDQYAVALYFQTRIDAHIEQLEKSCDNIDKHIQLVQPELVGRDVKIIAAEQMILRELLYGAKYLLSKDVFKLKITFDEKKYLDPEFYTKRKIEQK